MNPLKTNIFLTELSPARLRTLHEAVQDLTTHFMRVHSDSPRLCWPLAVFLPLPAPNSLSSYTEVFDLFGLFLHEGEDSASVSLCGYAVFLVPFVLKLTFSQVCFSVTSSDFGWLQKHDFIPGHSVCFHWVCFCANAILILLLWLCSRTWRRCGHPSSGFLLSFNLFYL